MEEIKTKQTEKINSANNKEFAEKLKRVSQDVFLRNLEAYKELSYR